MIEGRKPNFHISVRIAKHSGEKAEYIGNRGFGDQHYKQMICDYLDRFKAAKRADIDALLLDKLPCVLDEKQKSNKIKNLLQALKYKGLIEPGGKSWRMSKSVG